MLIPFYNEAGNIQPLLDEVHAALDGVDYEIVCVNDCSGDATAAELVAAQAASPDRIKILTHVKRRGKSAALFTGLRHCAGDWVQLLDGDGQNDPADARRVWDLVAAKDENPALGIICGRRTSRNDSGLQMAAVARRQRRAPLLPARRRHRHGMRLQADPPPGLPGPALSLRRCTVSCPRWSSAPAGMCAKSRWRTGSACTACQSTDFSDVLAPDL